MPDGRTFERRDVEMSQAGGLSLVSTVGDMVRRIDAERQAAAERSCEAQLIEEQRAAFADCVIQFRDGDMGGDLLEYLDTRDKYLPGTMVRYEHNEDGTSSENLALVERVDMVGGTPYVRVIIQSVTLDEAGNQVMTLNRKAGLASFFDGLNEGNLTREENQLRKAKSKLNGEASTSFIIKRDKVVEAEQLTRGWMDDDLKRPADPDHEDNNPFLEFAE